MSPVRLLCIETALSGCSVCLSEDEQILAQSVSTVPNSASDQLHKLAEEVLQTSGKQFSDIHAIAVSNGPGSYTGLRIGTAAAKGYAYALQIPIIAISTLQIMAAAAKNRLAIKADLYVPAIDARRNEVFWGMYDQALHQAIPDASLIVDETIHKLFDKNQRVCFLGSGTQKLCTGLELPNSILVSEITCLSSDMVQLALAAYTQKDFADAAYLEPNYTKEFYTPTSH